MVWSALDDHNLPYLRRLDVFCEELMDQDIMDDFMEISIGTELRNNAYTSDAQYEIISPHENVLNEHTREVLISGPNPDVIASVLSQHIVAAMSLSLMQQYLIAYRSYDGPGQLRPEEVPYAQTRVDGGMRVPIPFAEMWWRGAAARQPPIDQAQTRLHFLVTDPQDTSLISLTFEINMEGLFDRMLDLILGQRFFGHNWHLEVVVNIVTVRSDPNRGSHREEQSRCIIVHNPFFGYRLQILHSSQRPQERSLLKPPTNQKVKSNKGCFTWLKLDMYRSKTSYIG